MTIRTFVGAAIVTGSAFVLAAAVGTPAASADATPDKVIGTQTTTLVAPDPGPGYSGFGDRFGGAVAVSGSTLAIGAGARTVGGTGYVGVVYVYVKKGSSWVEQAEIPAPSQNYDEGFGAALALHGSTLVVGAEGLTVNGHAYQGGAYVYARKGSTWSLQATLLASDGAAQDFFGVSVVLSGSSVVIGALYAGANDAGGAYVFTRKGTAWTQQAKLTASDGAQDDSFGCSVGYVGTTIVVGASGHATSTSRGAVYVYTGKGASWSQQTELSVPSPGGAYDDFGTSVSMSGSTLLVGDDFATIDGHNAQGTAFVFVRKGTTWTQQAQLDATDAVAQDQAGWQVALSGSTAVVGAPFGTVNGLTTQGRAFVYTKKGTTWSQSAELTMADPQQYEAFGAAVSISGSTVAVGAPDANLGGLSAEGTVGVFK